MSYHLSSIHYTSSQFAPTPPFASASSTATATDRVRHPLWSGRTCAPTPDDQQGPIPQRRLPAAANPLCQPTVPECHQISDQTGKSCHMATGSRTSLCLIITIAAAASAAAVCILLFILKRPFSFTFKADLDTDCISETVALAKTMTTAPRMPPPPVLLRNGLVVCRIFEDSSLGPSLFHIFPLL